eukprot:3308985-Pleurochrysis_carterae.AAC.1
MHPSAPFLQSPKSDIHGHGKSRRGVWGSAALSSRSRASTAPSPPPRPPTLLEMVTPGSGSFVAPSPLRPSRGAPLLSAPPPP